MPHLKSYSAIGVLLALVVGVAWYASVHSAASTPVLADSVPPTWTEYTDDVFHFKVSYPADWDVHEYAEDEAGARTVVFEGPS